VKPTRRSRAESKEQTRAALLRAAGDLFADVGYNGTTVEAIVERAGFTRGAFYANFTDKADVFATLLAETRQHAMARIREQVAAADDTDKVGVIQRWYDSLNVENPWGLAYAEFWPQAIRDPAMRARLGAVQAATHGAIEDTLADYCAMAGLELPIPVSEMAAMILAVADGVAAQRRLDPPGLAPDAFMRTVTYLWLGVLADTSTPSPSSSRKKPR
jgi:AcrR family transcriptional regulator